MKILNLCFLLCASVVLSQSPIIKYELENSSINDENSNFGTAFFGEDKVVFSQPNKKGKKWKENKQPFLDLYIASIGKDGSLSKVKALPSSINSELHEAGVAFSKDLNTIYFTRNDEYVKQLGKKNKEGRSTQNIYRATRKGNAYTNVELLSFNTNTYSCGLPALSNDGKTMYFVSDMPGSIGATDLYKMEINADGSFGEAINLGDKVNSKGKEMFPFVDRDNHIYFASDRAGGQGGLDVYMYDPVTNTVEHLPEPINGKSDDFAFIIDHSKNMGYLSSNRSRGKGDDDIYSFKVINCEQNLNGIVTDAASGEFLANVLITLLDTKSNEHMEAKTDASGAFNFELSCNATYEITADLTGYSSSKHDLTTDTTFGDNVKQNIKLIADVIEIKDDELVIKINPIYFDSDKSNIRPDAATELDKVVEVMNTYPKMKIEAGSHTDSVGKDSYNKTLSKKRAQATVDYIVSKGIAKGRISAKGYGESQLVNKCTNGVKCSDQEHQQNRRTEFVIKK